MVLLVLQLYTMMLLQQQRVKSGRADYLDYSLG